MSSRTKPFIVKDGSWKRLINFLYPLDQFYYPLFRCSAGGEETSGGCSDVSDLEEDLRAELDSPASSCDFSCNCIASGNQILFKLNVQTYEDCGGPLMF